MSMTYINKVYCCPCVEIIMQWCEMAIIKLKIPSVIYVNNILIKFIKYINKVYQVYSVICLKIVYKCTFNY